MQPVVEERPFKQLSSRNSLLYTTQKFKGAFLGSAGWARRPLLTASLPWLNCLEPETMEPRKQAVPAAKLVGAWTRNPMKPVGSQMYLVWFICKPTGFMGFVVWFMIHPRTMNGSTCLWFLPIPTLKTMRYHHGETEWQRQRNLCLCWGQMIPYWGQCLLKRWNILMSFSAVCKRKFWKWDATFQEWWCSWNHTHTLSALLSANFCWIVSLEFHTVEHSFIF